MEEFLLLTVKSAVQAGDDLLISPQLPAGQYEFDLNGRQRVKIVMPDGKEIEKEVEISIPLGTRSREYILLFPNTRANEIPADTQIWIRKSSDGAPS